MSDPIKVGSAEEVKELAAKICDDERRACAKEVQATRDEERRSWLMCQQTAALLAERIRSLGILMEDGWRDAAVEPPPLEYDAVLAAIDGGKFAVWAAQSENNRRFYEDNWPGPEDSARVAVVEWNCEAVRHWSARSYWLTHWRPLPAPPTVEGEHRG